MVRRASTLLVISLGLWSPGEVLGFTAAPGAGRFAPSLRGLSNVLSSTAADRLSVARSSGRHARLVQTAMTAVGSDVFEELGLKVVPRDQERLRFAPSPTGSLHVGGARTALYSYLAAKKAGGKFVLRIEDTDLARSTKESEDSMIQDLRWLGLDWDEGPYCGGPAEQYRQSERGEVYVKLAKKLVEMGWAYPCFCTEDELEAKRKAAEESGSAVAYDGAWRDADPAEVQKRMDAGEPFTYRFKVPKGKVVTINDLVRGRISWDVEATLGDFILLRSNGVPVYNFCVAVDDAMMGITTVARAEEHLTNTVRQALVLEALGFPLPEYAHCSLILGEDRSKLSKRHGATSCDQFRQQGYLADAMINYLALLGWNDGTDKDIYTRQELIESFDLNRVTPSPAQFDPSKLKWINGQHLRAMPKDKFMPLLEEGLLRDGVLAKADSTLIAHIAGMVQEKCDLLTDASAIVLSCLDYELAETAKTCEESAAILGDDFAALAAAINDSMSKGEFPKDMKSDSFEKEFKEWISALGKTTGRKGKRLFMPVRLALTGNLAGPDIGLQLKTLGLAADSQPKKLVTLEERLQALTSFVAENPELLKNAAASVQSSGTGGAGIPDDRVAQKIIETVAKLTVVQQRQVLSTAEQLLAAGGGEAAAARGKGKGSSAPTGKVLDRSGNVEPVTRLDIRVGKIVSCEKHPDADSLYLEQIDVGEEEPRTVISGLANFVPLDEMQGRMVAVVCNLKPVKMRGILSAGMVLCGSNEEHSQVEILDPPAGAQPGEHLMLEEFGIMKPDEADAVLKSKSQQNVWKIVAPALKLVNGEATYDGKLFTTSAGPLTCKNLKDGTVG